MPNITCQCATLQKICSKCFVQKCISHIKVNDAKQVQQKHQKHYFIARHCLDHSMSAFLQLCTCYPGHKNVFLCCIVSVGKWPGPHVHLMCFAACCSHWNGWAYLMLLTTGSNTRSWSSRFHGFSLILMYYINILLELVYKTKQTKKQMNKCQLSVKSNSFNLFDFLLCLFVLLQQCGLHTH